MKQLLVCVALMGLMAATAVAEPFDQPVDRSGWEIITTVSAERIDAGSPRAYVPQFIYDQWGTGATVAGTAASSALGGTVSVDDYNVVGSSLGQSFLLRQFYFVGGMSAAGGLEFFTFYDNGFNVIGGFGIVLPYAGVYGWNITMSTPRDIPDGGYVNMWANDGSYTAYPVTQGLWDANDGTADIGTTAPVPYPNLQTTGGTYLDHYMAIVIPEPGTLALFGMGFLTLVVRRRK